MYSTFNVSKTECMTCTNKILKSLGSLQGVFGAEVDQIDGKITVSHTDEISRVEIAKLLFSLGYPEIEPNTEYEVNSDEASIWGCAL